MIHIFTVMGCDHVIASEIQISFSDWIADYLGWTPHSWNK